MVLRATIAAAVVILVLAVIQYRWIGQLSRAERERLTADVQAGSARFSQEFNGEILRAFLALQIGRPEGNGRDTDEAAERINGWRSSSPYRRVVRGFFRTRGGVAGMDEFLEYDPANEKFEPSAWPARLAELRARLEERSRDGFAPGGVRVEEDVPAVVGMRPILGGEGQPPVLGGWSIVELDLDYIQKEWLPELARKHFGDTYTIAVVSRADASRVIYGTPPAAGPDAAAGLFDLRPDPGPLRTAGPGRGMGFRGGFRPFPPQRPPDGEGPENARRVPPPGGGNPGNGDRGVWRLMVNHRAGSLDQAVSQVRERDLALSFLLLVLLGVSVAMVVISTRQAHRLAHQQMEFVAGVSHELRTPLTVIATASDNLADGVVAGEAQVKRYGSVIRQEVRRLTDMVEQLLRFSGLQSGRAQFKLAAVEVEPVVERALASCQPDLRDSGVEVQVDIQDGVPAVTADAPALVHCIANLVANALKHAREGKWVGISARLADFGEAAVEILVEDHGPGIDPADLPHLFEPFYRGRRAVSNQIKGAGLGLSLVKRIVEGQGGTVTATSKPGEGSCFRLRLPMAARGGV